ncbi:MAG: tRNA1(Val) (adenine(37)-N6)-methyltransferase [Bacilli bacterium]|nr:tRNA1(Val) (adenine(37)-N6)-methyltransferase [Bacilli bacterium]
MEVLNDLLDYNNLKIYQNTDWFLFSLDSVLLPNFVTLNKKIKTIMDLGTGNAPIPLILSTKTKAKIIGIEVQKDVYDLAQKSVLYNHLENQIELCNLDIRDLKKYFQGDSIDVITCNPPYFKVSETSNLNEDVHKVIARHELNVKLEDILMAARYLLKNNGILAIVHRTDRFLDILRGCSTYGLEVKRVRFIYPKVNSESNMILVEARKNGGVGLKILPPLYVHRENGDYTDEVLKMFQ